MDGLTEHRPIASLPFGGKYRPSTSRCLTWLTLVSVCLWYLQNENISSVFDHIRSGREGLINTPQPLLPWYL